MKKEEILEILKSVNFAPSNLDMGWEWDVKESKIYDGSIVVEKGFCIRTTFMRPDVNSGDIEKGYGRWMYIPDNISTDGLVKTAWLCAELIVKHELMEAFLYEGKRIFDPHKSIKDLQHNANEVSVETKDNISKGDSVNIIHAQNIDNHTTEISSWLEAHFKLDTVVKDDDIERDATKYNLTSHKVFHKYSGEHVVILTDTNGKVVDSAAEDKYTLSNVIDMLSRFTQADPGDVNAKILEKGYNEVRNVDGSFIYAKGSNTDYFVVHTEGKGLAKISEDNRTLLSTGNMQGGYTQENVEKILSVL